MAGGYNHIVTEDGNLGSNEFVVDMLENGGDVFEAVEEMYGMIWYLTYQLAPLSDGMAESALGIHRQDMKALVEKAQKNYEEGLKIAKEVHQNRGGE